MTETEASRTAGPATVAVSVTLFADLRRFLPRGADGPQRYVLPDGATVAELLEAIGIPAGSELTAAVNGELAALDAPLAPDDEVMLLSPMEGGSATDGAPAAI